MSETRGVVINVHHLGATVRLDDGTLATVAASELAAHRPAYLASLEQRTALTLHVLQRGRHPTVSLAPVPEPAPVAEPRGPRLVDPVFESHMTAYLKETEAWAPSDRPAPAERHFIRKRRRAKLFEARNTGA